MKKHILTESQYNFLLKEASGVPKNITNVASQIYNQFIKDLKNDEQSVKDFNNTEFKINGNFEIGDVIFKDSYINLSLIGGSDEITQYQFGVNPKDYQYFTNDLKLKPKSETLPIIVDVGFMVSSDTTVKDFKNYLISNETEYVSTLAHEIKHAYDSIKTPKPNVGAMANYVANISMSVDGFEEFFYNLYYIENAENLVRPTEIITQIEKLGITKKDFLKFITSNKVVTQLKKIQSFSFKNLYDSILEKRLEKNKNRRELNSYTLEYTSLPPKKESEIIQELNNDLDEIFQIHKEKRVESFIIILEEMFDTKEISEEYKENAIEKFKKDTNKLFGGNSANFYREAEKVMKTKSTKVLRKIYGLYDLTKDNPNNIKNNQKIFEAIGANSMNPDPKGLFLTPDQKTPSALTYKVGASGTIPTHWNNSPFLSGGRITSAFGANPSGKKRTINRVLTYDEFVETSKKHSR
jgi:hypothetical protein